MFNCPEILAPNSPEIEFSKIKRDAVAAVVLGVAHFFKQNHRREKNSSTHANETTH